MKVIDLYINVQYVIYLDFNVSHDIVTNKVNELI